jgi:hypothetical protein
MVSAARTRHRVAAALVLACAAAAATPAVAHDGGRCYPVWYHHHWVCAGPSAPTTAAPASTSVPADTDPATTSDPAPAPAGPEPVPTVLPSVSPTASSQSVADPAPTAAAPPPVLGRTVAAAATAGTVTVRTPDGKTMALDGATALPTGSRLDTRVGEVALTSAIDAKGATQTGRFSGGVFEVRQAKGGGGLTKLVLVGGHWADCSTGGYVTRAMAATRKKARKPIRTLWGSDDHGRFQTQGGGSVATVRGTHWLTTDTCDGTRTTVLAGAVSVRSRRTGHTVLVRAGHTVFVKR